MESAKTKVAGAADVAGTIGQISTGQGDISTLEKKAADANYFTSGQYMREQQALAKEKAEKRKEELISQYRNLQNLPRKQKKKEKKRILLEYSIMDYGSKMFDPMF